MNYDRFVREYTDKLEEITSIGFYEKDDMSVSVTIADDPSKYTNIAPKCVGLKSIRLNEIGTQEYYKSVCEFIKRSNDGVVIKNGPLGKATKEEFLRSEEIINGIIDEINPEWNAKQKAAFVHYKMGELISYMPDFNFSKRYGEVMNDARSIWKSIDNRQSVCNGVTNIQRTILSRIGVKTRELSSRTHSFMLVETEEGNIITDATWDLTNTLFEAYPMYFGKTYEQLREIDGELSKAHSLKDMPENIIEIPEQELRKIYQDIGIANEEGRFKIPILSRVDEISKQHFNSDKEKIDSLLEMFTNEFPEQAKHLSESRTMLENCMVTLGMNIESINTNFVYFKEDEDCEKSYLCIHLENEGMNRKIAVLNTEKMKFENLSLREFDEVYKVHNEDSREPFWKRYMQREDDIRETEQDKEERQ